MTTDLELHVLRMEHPDLVILRKPSKENSHYGECGIEHGVLAGHRDTDDPLVMMYPELKHRDYKTLFKDMEAGIPKGQVRLLSASNPGKSRSFSNLLEGMSAERTIPTAVVHPRRPSKDSLMMEWMRDLIYIPKAPWMDIFEVTSLVEPLTPREVKRKFTNQFNGTNRNGLPSKRGKR